MISFNSIVPRILNIVIIGFNVVMLFGLLMNFPRIKKVLRSEEELK